MNCDCIKYCVSLKLQTDNTMNEETLIALLNYIEYWTSDDQGAISSILNTVDSVTNAVSSVRNLGGLS